MFLFLYTRDAMIRIREIQPAPCADCGGAPLHHRLEWTSALLDTVITPVLDPVGRFGMKRIPRLSGALENTVPSLLRLFEKIGLGDITYAYDDRDFKFVTMCLWDEANRRNIRLWQFRPFGMVKHLFVAQYGDETVVYERTPVAKGASRGISWIDDKRIVKKKLQKQGMPVSRGSACLTESQALAVFSALRKPVIVKPHQGSGTRHTTLHITDKEEMLRAFRIARRLSPLVMVEEELRGSVYRPTVVDGKLVATIRRDPPFITGDGTHSIAELVAKENEHPKRSGPVFSPIEITDTVLKELERQHCSPASIPQKDQKVFLHQKVNWGVGGHTTDVTDDVHPDNRTLFEEIARVTRAPILGIDFIIEDISRSWKEQELCGVIECNSMPFFDTHHLPFHGQPRDVAGAIWDMVFPASKQSA